MLQNIPGIDNSITRTMKIPLIGEKYITIKFARTSNDTWVAEVTDEAMEDMQNFWSTGYYKLDPTEQIEFAGNI